MAITVGRWARSSGSSAGASVLRATTTRTPADSAPKVHMKEPTCDIDEPGRSASAGVSSRAAATAAHIQARVSNEWVTPLAGPVLPDVKKITAGAAGSIGAGAPGGAAARSSNRGPLAPGPSYQRVSRGSRPA